MNCDNVTFVTFVITRVRHFGHFVILSFCRFRYSLLFEPIFLAYLLISLIRAGAIKKNVNRYVHAYFSDNAEVMMELEGIDLMFSDQKIMPMPIKDYRKYMKERKDELTNRKGK